MRKMNKILSLLLCMVLLLGNAAPVFAQEGEDAVLISSLEDFLEFAENCRLDSYSQGKTFRLTVDIDLSGTDFDGIPIFCGTFEGTHHTISGLNILTSGSAKGLFRYVEPGATVRDLRVQGTVTPTGSRAQVGGIAGSNAGVIENCSFTGTVVASEYAGGIAGVNQAGGLITGCSTEGTLSAYHFSGGIAGSNEGTIRDCTNLSGINVTAQQNDIDISDITLGTLTSTESAAATTDIGGIAGYSSGTILGCTNRGAVGYKHMGYNVGGIVGVQVGYIADCENYGAVSGRKEVGGIVGQQEPEVVVHYNTDTLQILEGQLAVLSDLIDRAASNGNANASNIRNLMYRLEKYVADAEDALEYLKSGLENPKWEDLQSYADALQTIRDSITGIDTTLRSLWDAVDETMTDLDSDMKAITQQMSVIENTLNNAEDNLGGQVFDSSDADTAEDLTSKVENCRNFGAIQGDLNAGGIIGAVVFENDLDPEEDISVVGDTTLNAIGSLRSVILGCTNSGTVTAKNQRIGGIVGWLSMGLVRDCVNTGALENPSADYVGGIAGYARGYIRGCKVKSIINGKAFVGGIAGSGTIVSDCYAMVRLSGSEKSGCIFGYAEDAYADVETPVLGNYYLQYGADAGAIDGISYSGKAQGLSQEEFFARQVDCPIFSQVTITFVADGQVVETLTQVSGTSLESIPQVPPKEGFDGHWDGLADADLDCVLFDLNLQAVYTAYAITVQSDLTDGNGRPILLLQGDFSGSGAVTVTQLQNFAALQEGQTLIEGWKFNAEHCVSLHAARMLMPADADMERAMLLVRDENGNWKEHVYSIEGSYLVFSLAKGDDAIALVQVQQESIFTAEVLIAGAAGALLVLIVVVICTAIRKKARKKPTDETEE